MHPERFKNFASIMIAFVTILGAMAVCLGSVATNQAGNADFDGLNAGIHAQEAQIISEVITHEHYRSYIAYFRYNELGALLYDESLKPEADPDRLSALGVLQREVWGVATGLTYNFFPPRYLTPKGGYDIQREFDERLADAASTNDLNSEPHFLLADSLRTKAILFTTVLIILAVSFWFFTAAEVTENRAKYFFLGVGLLLTLTSLIVGLAIQFLI